MDTKKAKELLKKYRKGTLTPSEHQQLDDWYIHHARAEKPMKNAEVHAKRLREMDEAFPFVPASSFRKKQYWPRVAAVFLILMLVGGAGLYFFFPQLVPGPQVATVHENEILPGGNRASLRLADGRTIDLSTKQPGIVTQGGITYTDGSAVLAESAADNNFQTPTSRLLTLATPKGGQYQAILPDGTKVWLNADSKLRYPMRFEGGERVVSLEGEAYFEVAHNQRRPFIVKGARQEVRVLGTSFNLAAYPDEAAVTTTLLKGAVAVQLSGTSRDSLIRLAPGEASVLRSGRLKKQTTDTERAVAWKNGKFMFEDERIEPIMRKMARWYNVEINYIGESPDAKFWGSVSRFDEVSRVLNILELTGNVHFKIKGREIYVSKNPIN